MVNWWMLQYGTIGAPLEVNRKAERIALVFQIHTQSFIPAQESKCKDL